MNTIVPTEKARQIESLAHAALDASGALKGFKSQMVAYKFGEMPSGDMFIVSESSAKMRIPTADDLLLVMTQKTMGKIESEHELSPAFIARLPELIQGHVLAMESLTYPNSVVLVLDARDHSGNDVLAAVHLKVSKNIAEVNEVASLYGKEQLAYMLENTVAAGKRVYVNEKTGDWVSRAGVPFPERTFNHLQNLLYQRESLPDGYIWKTWDAEPGKSLYAPDGTLIVEHSFGTHEYRDALHGGRWRHCEEDLPLFAHLAWEHHDAKSEEEPDTEGRKLPVAPTAAKMAKPDLSRDEAFMRKAAAGTARNARDASRKAVI